MEWGNEGNSKPSPPPSPHLTNTLITPANDSVSAGSLLIKESALGNYSLPAEVVHFPCLRGSYIIDIHFFSPNFSTNLPSDPRFEHHYKKSAYFTTTKPPKKLAFCTTSISSYHTATTLPYTIHLSYTTTTNLHNYHTAHNLTHNLYS